MINNVVMTGRLTRDPEMRYTDEGVAFTVFALAVERNFTNSQGEREVDFVDIITWRKLAENCAQFLAKGRMVAVSGRLQIRKTIKEEKTYYNTEVVAENVQFLDWPLEIEKGENKARAEAS